MIINGSDLVLAKPILNMTSIKEKSHGVSFGLSEAGYDIRIKQDVRFSRAREKRYVSVEHNHKRAIHDGIFALASSIEKFDMPNHLVGIVHDKSTWARKGLSVFNTVIEPGWRGFLTLELVYHGSTELHIPAGSGIAQVVFHETVNTASYNGKYQNQEDKPVNSIAG